MRISSLEINNFKAIKHLNISDLKNTVVIAGPNGCGKSTVFDAIRLIKSVYAGYNGNELQSWMGEFGIKQNLVSGLTETFQSKVLPMSISMRMELNESERRWLKENADEVLTMAAFQAVGGSVDPMSSARLSHSMVWYRLSDDFRRKEPEIRAQVDREMPSFLDELDKPLLLASMEVSTRGANNVIPNTCLSKIFAIYDSQNVGVIEYHSPQRTFGRESVAQISLATTAHSNRQQHALSNTAGKYGSVKSELANSYVRSMIAEKADGDEEFGLGINLENNLKELFDTFFPGKQFLGMIPEKDGGLSFNVETGVGIHDIDNLSSGEKELLYGYLRLRSYAPKHSVILIDEPELHLNPRLTQGLPDFYSRHIGEEFDNQLWLVTHSDAILRQCVGQEGYSVFHMQPMSSLVDGGEQVREITIDNDLDRAIVDLVGDLAAYKPNGKLVFIEGGGESETDLMIISNLFPNAVQSLNVVSLGSRREIGRISRVVEAAKDKSLITNKIYSIVDSDNIDGAALIGERHFRWDRYHIENYLLEPLFIRQVLADLNVQNDALSSDDRVMAELKNCAAECRDSLVRHEIEHYFNGAIRGVARLNLDRQAILSSSLVKSCSDIMKTKIDELFYEKMSENAISENINLWNDQYSSYLSSDEWIKKYRGRDVLKRFTNKFLNGTVKYEIFRNLIVAAMRKAQFQPSDLKNVLDTILND